MEPIRKLLAVMRSEEAAVILGVSNRTIENWRSGRNSPSRVCQREINRVLEEIRAAKPGNSDAE